METLIVLFNVGMVLLLYSAILGGLMWCVYRVTRWKILQRFSVARAISSWLEWLPMNDDRLMGFFLVTFFGGLRIVMSVRQGYWRGFVALPVWLTALWIIRGIRNVKAASKRSAETIPTMLTSGIPGYRDPATPTEPRPPTPLVGFLFTIANLILAGWFLYDCGGK